MPKIPFSCELFILKDFGLSKKLQAQYKEHSCVLQWDPLWVTFCPFVFPLSLHTCSLPSHLRIPYRHSALALLQHLPPRNKDILHNHKMHITPRKSEANTTPCSLSGFTSPCRISLLPVFMKFCWNLATLVHSRAVCGCFSPAAAEMSSWKRDIPHKPEIYFTF